MENTAEPVAEPTPETLGGHSAGQTLQRLIVATRPQFLTASALPVLVGTAWGFSDVASFELARFLLALAATICVHAASNVLNDVGDELGGSDRINDGRMYPFSGGSRMIPNGVMTVRQMTALGIGLLLVALVAGLLLAMLAGPAVIGLGLIGVLLGLAYSLPPLNLASRGMGETTIAITFGVLPVCGAAWLQSGQIDAATVLLSVPVGLWVTAILLINEVPDIPADAATGKRTLAVRLGTGGTRWLYSALHAVAMLSVAAIVTLGLLHWSVLLVSIPLAIIAIKLAAGISSGDRDRLMLAIRTTLLVHAIGCIALLAWTIAGGPWS